LQNAPVTKTNSPSPERNANQIAKEVKSSKSLEDYREKRRNSGDTRPAAAIKKEYDAHAPKVEKPVEPTPQKTAAAARATPTAADKKLAELAKKFAGGPTAGKNKEAKGGKLKEISKDVMHEAQSYGIMRKTQGATESVKALMQEYLQMNGYLKK
jgi:hypothetical protein